MNLMEDPKITQINLILESLSYWSSIYEIGASNDLVDLLDLISDLQSELKAAAAVLPAFEEETQAQDVVAVQKPRAEVLRAIFSLRGCSNELGSPEVPSLQQLMQLLNYPIAPEQIFEALPILKNIPSLLLEFLKKRQSMVKQYKRYQRQQLKLQEQQSQQPQQEQPGPEQDDQPGMGVVERHFTDYPELSGDPQNPELMQRCMDCLVHACQCEADCELASCRRMKRMMRHIYHCKPQSSSDCLICKQLYELSCHHTRVCRVKENCPMPFCFFIKQKDKEDALHELMPMLRNPKIPEMRNRVFQIFKKKPDLFAEIVKDRENWDYCTSLLVSLDLEEESSPADANQVNPEGEQSSSLVQRCTQPKIHNRQKINKMMMHVKNCKKTIDGYCLSCKRLRNFYGHHAILCQEEGNNCSIPFCFNVKRRLKELPECHRSLYHQLQRRYSHWMP